MVKKKKAGNVSGFATTSVPKSPSSDLSTVKESTSNIRLKRSSIPPTSSFSTSSSNSLGSKGNFSAAKSSYDSTSPSSTNPIYIKPFLSDSSSSSTSVHGKDLEWKRILERLESLGDIKAGSQLDKEENGASVSQVEKLPFLRIDSYLEHQMVLYLRNAETKRSLDRTLSRITWSGE